MKENIVSVRFKKLRIFLQLAIVALAIVYGVVYFLVTDFPPAERFSNRLYAVIYMMIPAYLALIGVLIRFCCAKKLKRAEVIIYCILNIIAVCVILNMTYQILEAIKDIKLIENPYDPILNPTEYNSYIKHLDDVSFSGVVYFMFGTFLLRWAAVGISIVIAIFSLKKSKHKVEDVSSQQAYKQTISKNNIEQSGQEPECVDANAELEFKAQKENCFIYCIHCGKKIKKDAKFCMYCGKLI